MKNKPIYEKISVCDPSKSLLFCSSNETSPCYLHWHNEIEFLFFAEPGALTLGNDSIEVNPYSFITINRNELHSVEKGKYYSLIVLDTFFIVINRCF